MNKLNKISIYIQIFFTLRIVGVLLSESDCERICTQIFVCLLFGCMVHYLNDILGGLNAITARATHTNKYGAECERASYDEEEEEKN